MPKFNSNPWATTVANIEARPAVPGASPPAAPGVCLLGRPQGALRAALLQAAAELVMERQAEPLRGLDGAPVVGATWFELRQRAQVDTVAGRQTLDNALRAGYLAAVGKVRVAGAARPLFAYAPRSPTQKADDGLALQNILTNWGRP